MTKIILKSVGSVINLEDMCIHPMLAQGAHCVGSGVHLEDVEDEWFCNLSSDDLLEFFNFIEETQDLTTIVYNEWKTSIWGMWEEHNNCFLNLEAK